jgi:hypothetical protein
MAQTCKRRPGGGGAAVRSLTGDGPHFTRSEPQHPEFDLAATWLANRWVEQRFRVTPGMAAAIATAAGLGGPAR